MNQEMYDNSIAIIGMSGYFPKAKNTQEFWEKLINGEDCITRFTDEELQAEGEDPSLLQKTNYVRAKGTIDYPESFDAGFFGISPAEAMTIDPQQRIFLELCWSSIEDAGINLDKEDREIGVFGAGGMSTYLLHNLSKNPHLFQENDRYQLMLGNDKDYLSTRVSYKLNLSGPSMTIQTACSSSLVAVHTACQSLLNGECDMALAGGVSVSFPHKRGYLYHKGMILSPDGHCKPFDADAEGTVEGTGAGVVLLKRLEDAVNDNDRIYAVIRGSAINNDGAEKVGYTAPSVNQQAAVIREAMDIAGVDSSEISYVETHGTGTPLGDPIEIAALIKAFRQQTDKIGYCAIGSLKSNIGHLNSAAGIASLIKVALSLKNECIPASLHFTAPNPKIPFEKSPFLVNNQTRKWERGNKSRFAGISSFGIGGTNAHLILEEAPIPFKTIQSNRPWHALTISAKTEEAAIRNSMNLKDFLEKKKDIDISDVAFTLQTGRKEHEFRQSFICRTLEDATKVISEHSNQVSLASNNSKVVWMFSGQGSQHVGMAREIYASEPIFKREFDACCEILRPHLLGQDLHDLIFAETNERERLESKLKNTAFAQPALFTLEYSLAKLLMSWGMKPEAMLGHSVGEYVAATLAEVMSLQDALAVIAFRGRLMQSLPEGSMLSVVLNENELQKRLERYSELSIAAINTINNCVVSGPTDAIEVFRELLEKEGISSKLLHTSHAFHSAMMNPILEQFTEFLRGIKFAEPSRPFMSNVTGKWITKEQACSPNYWAKHLRETVRFTSMIQFLEKEGFSQFVEVGPGQSLSSLTRQIIKSASTVPLLPSVRENIEDDAHLMRAIGKLWCSGIHVDWPALYEDEIREKVELPLYSFDRQLYSFDTSQLVNLKREDAQKTETLKSTIYKERQNIKTEYVPPENELELVLAEFWQDLFHVNPIGRNDDFFELGGNSLMAIQLLGRVKSIFQVEVSVNELFKNPTVEGLAYQVLEGIEVLTEEQAEEIERILSSRLLEVNSNEN
ncbi:beta-ketoacyl synthase N-terminal-like domain-containing protein [Bacillus thuringiensis]|uniref:type I polyketide synthase n=1 Tax=Bacillus thuringiensis TaxID=1428 RepID=UPI0033992E6F